MKNCTDQVLASRLVVYFSLWRGAFAQSWAVYSDAAWTFQYGYAATRYFEKSAAVMWYYTSRLLHIKNKVLRSDREKSFNTFVGMAAAAARCHDFARLHKIVQKLAGKPPDPHKGINDEAGVLLTDASAIGQRWLRHHANVLSAIVSKNVSSHCPVVPPSAGTSDFNPTFDDVCRYFFGLNGRRGLGLDGISALVRKCGGKLMATLLWRLVAMAVSRGRYPVLWRGGRLINIFKRKGSAADCDSWRGILVSDHAGKVLSSLLYENIEEKYQRFVGSSQFGGVPAMGTALASHVLRSMMDLARLRHWSIFVLFIDLTKAYDRLIRELVIGWPDGLDSSERTHHLHGIGVDPSFIKHITEMIESERPVLEQAGIDIRVVDLLRVRHYPTWWATRLQTWISYFQPWLCCRPGPHSCQATTGRCYIGNHVQSSRCFLDFEHGRACACSRPRCRRRAMCRGHLC